MADAYLLTLLLISLLLIIGATSICCYICRRCCRRERNGLPYSYHFPSSHSSSSSDTSSSSSSPNLLNSNDIDPLNAFPPFNGLVDDRVVYVYQYNPNGEEFMMGTEGGNVPGLINGRPQPAYGGNGRYYVPQMPLISHPPYYDDEPPKYEDIMNLTVLGNEGGGSSSSATAYQGAQGSSTHIEMEPYRDEVDDDNNSVGTTPQNYVLFSIYPHQSYCTVTVIAIVIQTIRTGESLFSKKLNNCKF
ncbi:10058_t:CDS:2 [Ambispora leptoticha]|uniref:10058_t:CDS:1 n=1 Tax=Ambispora leptoticha TaxID=144679 RepID=A0A9N9B603_9GLOM|nr:10058_t:CDS:2 [Ambispora leptoticha]